jgi:hypothetical protein
VFTPETIARYQSSTWPTSSSSKLSAAAIAAVASGAARPARRSGSGAVASTSNSRTISARSGPVNRPRTAAGLNGSAQGRRCAVCAAPSVDSMLGPTI